jgi:hypothetical protein
VIQPGLDAFQSRLRTDSPRQYLFNTHIATVEPTNFTLDKFFDLIKYLIDKNFYLCVSVPMVLLLRKIEISPSKRAEIEQRSPEDSIKGHVMTIIDYDFSNAENRTFTVKNSWGAKEPYFVFDETELQEYLRNREKSYLVFASLFLFDKTKNEYEVSKLQEQWKHQKLIHEFVPRIEQNSFHVGTEYNIETENGTFTGKLLQIEKVTGNSKRHGTPYKLTFNCTAPSGNFLIEIKNYSSEFSETDPFFIIDSRKGYHVTAIEPSEAALAESAAAEEREMDQSPKGGWRSRRRGRRKNRRSRKL